MADNLQATKNISKNESVHRLLKARNQSEQTISSFYGSLQHHSVDPSSNFSSIAGSTEVNRIERKNEELAGLLGNRLTAINYYLEILKDSKDLNAIKSEELKDSFEEREVALNEVDSSYIGLKATLGEILRLIDKEKQELGKLECAKKELIELENEEQLLAGKFHEVQMTIEELVENQRASIAVCKCQIF